MIEYCEYALRGRGRLNARRSEAVVRGYLVRAGGGVACLQTWPELGDPGLEEALWDFAGERRLAVSRQAWRCCEWDGAARREGRHLLEGLEIPQSHYTMPEGGWKEVPVGFTEVKIKAGGDGEALRRGCEQLREDLRIRLDFNEGLEAAGFRRIWRLLEAFGERIDFVEDPVPYEEGVWRSLEEECGCRLAVDAHEGEAPFLRVWKPARRDWEGRGEVVVTSNMDHPVGQVFAAYCAGKASRDGAKVPGCGLVTQHLFEGEDAFGERMGVARPAFPRVGGTGLGFDDLLERLPWRRW